MEIEISMTSKKVAKYLYVAQNDFTFENETF